jgi:predicted DCC family thiol-disulfide oxidoreductase YuxK
VYRFIARHRHRWFGKTDHCPLPTGEHADRFVGDDG